MAKTNAQRQAAYRARHLHEGGGERLNIVLDVHAKRALERLAICYAVTQRAMLERLLIDAEHVALDRVAKSGDYCDGRARLDVVTPKPIIAQRFQPWPALPPHHADRRRAG